MLGVDCSNYTGSLSQEALACWKQQGVGLVIVQCVDPPRQYPATQTRQQLQALAEAGIPTDVYVYLWWDNPGLVIPALALADGYDYGRIWIDVEDVSGGHTVAARIDTLRDVIAAIRDAYPSKPLGIYTGRWYWLGYMANTPEFSDLPLWAAQFDGVVDRTVFSAYGGWGACLIKQYQGDAELCGVRGIDLNALEESAIVAGATLEPTGLAHLDSAWGHLADAGKLTRSARIRGHLQQARDELLLVKQEAGWE